MNTNPLLEMIGIEKHFGGVRALAGASFMAEPGQVHALVGENGAGKSTLMKILAGILPPSAGEIRVAGSKVHIGSPADSQRLGIAFVPQRPDLVPIFDVARNIFLGREPTNGMGIMDARLLRQEASRLLGELDAELSTRAMLSELTVAQKQEVAIAKALSLTPRIIVFDEPTAALTFREVNRLFDIVRLLKKNGATIIYISHRFDEVFAIADAITILRDGKTIRTLAAARTTAPEVIRLMIGGELGADTRKNRPLRGEPVLEVEDLRTDQLEAPASFTLHKAEVIGIFGLVGAGRTELVRAILGIDRKSRGGVRVRGEKVRRHTFRAMLARGMAYVPEDRNGQGLVMDLSIRNNISLANLARYRRLFFLSRGRENRGVQEIVRELEIKLASPRDPITSLSGGNQQKVVLAKWFSREPSIFVLDEPTNGIDVGTKNEIYGLVDALVKKGVAVLIISSEPEEILRVADRVLVMYKRRITAEFDAPAATMEKLMQAAMGAAQKT